MGKGLVAVFPLKGVSTTAIALDSSSLGAPQNDRCVGTRLCGYDGEVRRGVQTAGKYA